MKCPNCQETLVMTERKGVEIDYCPSCRGIWLDKGELDKIIEKSAAAEKEAYDDLEKKRKKRDNDDDDDDNKKRRKRDLDNDDDDDEDEGGFFNRNRKNDRGRDGGFLSNLFDF